MPATLHKFKPGVKCQYLVAFKFNHSDFVFSFFLSPASSERKYLRRLMETKLTAMGLHKPGRDKRYDSITPESSDDERLNLVFEILKNSHSPIIPDYYKLHIPHQRENVFDAKLKATGMVETGEFGLHQSIRLNTSGILILDKYGSFLNYLEATKLH